MATTSIEIVQSRDINIRDGIMTGVREWRVWETTGLPLTPPDALTDAGLPLSGDTFPGLPQLILSELITAERMPGNPNMVKVVWDYASPGGGLFDPFAAEWNVEVTAELIPVYRVPAVQDGQPALKFPNVQQQLTFKNTVTEDIGGESNDLRGARQSFLRHQMLIQASERRGGTRFGGEIGIRFLRDTVTGYAFLDSFVGTRNINVFLGFNRGLLLYVGASSHTLRRNDISITHHFVADEWFHLRQVAETDQDGDPLLAIIPNGPVDFLERPIPVAFPVYWRQPFNQFSDFSLISPNF